MAGEISKLTPEQESEALKKMGAFRKLCSEIPPGKQIAISSPDKYDFPVGMDDSGKLFPKKKM